MDATTWRTTLCERTWMLEHIRGKPSPRKLRLFACACASRVVELLPPGALEALRISLRFAEDLALGADLMRAAAAVGTLPRTDAQRAVAHAVDTTTANAFHAATWALAAAGRDHWQDELAAQCDLVRCVFGNPFRTIVTAAWMQNESVQQMAQVIAREGRLGDIPILADAMEDAGCDDAELLAHARDGLHAQGCDLVDLLLRKC